jgi:2Fe-2S ferredoxin
MRTFAPETQIQSRFMLKLQVTDTNGAQRVLEVEENPTASLMEALVEAHFDVPAICGGMAACGTCHVEVLKGQDQLDPPEGDESFMLDTLPNYTSRSRLSCQLRLTQALDGLEIRVRGDGA